jgi:hypothetical protein
LWSRRTRACAKLPVLFLKLGYATLKESELCFASVARVLCGDTITVCTGLLALFWCDF